MQSRSFVEPADAASLGRLDVAAIDKVCQQAWPELRSADELHDALVVLGFLTDTELECVDGARGGGPNRRDLLARLSGEKRTTKLRTPS